MKSDFSTQLKRNAITRADLLSKEKVGSQLRQVRRQKGLTLKQLAQKTGLALSSISKAELGQVALSYEKFVVLAAALDIEASSLFSSPSSKMVVGTPPAAPLIASHTPESRPGYATRNYDYGLMFGELPGKHMNPMMAVITSRNASEFDDYIRHPGQEFVIVLSGSVAIQFENGQTIQLGTHESAYFDSSLGHVYLSTSDEPAKVVAVCTPGRQKTRTDKDR